MKIKIYWIKSSDRFDLLLAQDEGSKVTSSSLYNMSTQRNGLSIRLYSDGLTALSCSVGLLFESLLHTRTHIHPHTYTHLPLCLFICMIISSCPKAQQQDIWCNTIAGSVPWRAPSALWHYKSIQCSILIFVRGTVQLCEAPLTLRGAERTASWGVHVRTQLVLFPPSQSSTLESPYLSRGFRLLKN